MQWVTAWRFYFNLLLNTHKKWTHHEYSVGKREENELCNSLWCEHVSAGWSLFWVKTSDNWGFRMIELFSLSFLNHVGGELLVLYSMLFLRPFNYGMVWPSIKEFSESSRKVEILWLFFLSPEQNGIIQGPKKKWWKKITIRIYLPVIHSIILEHSLSLLQVINWSVLSLHTIKLVELLHISSSDCIMSDTVILYFTSFHIITIQAWK